MQRQLSCRRRALVLPGVQPHSHARPPEVPPKADPASNRQRQHCREIGRGRCGDRANDRNARGTDKYRPCRKESSPQARRRYGKKTPDEKSDNRVCAVGRLAAATAVRERGGRQPGQHAESRQHDHAACDEEDASWPRTRLHPSPTISLLVPGRSCTRRRTARELPDRGAELEKAWLDRCGEP